MSNRNQNLSKLFCHLISKSQVEQNIIGGVFLPLHMNGPPDYPVGCLQLHMSKQESQYGSYILILGSYYELQNFPNHSHLSSKNIPSILYVFLSIVHPSAPGGLINICYKYVQKIFGGKYLYRFPAPFKYTFFSSNDRPYTYLDNFQRNFGALPPSSPSSWKRPP